MKKIISLLLFAALPVIFLWPSFTKGQAPVSDSMLLLKGVGALPVPAAGNICASYAIQPTTSILAVAPYPGMPDVSGAVMLSGKYGDGKGRIILISSEQYLDSAMLANPAVEKLIKNVLSLQSSGKTGLLGEMPALQRLLHKAGRPGVYQVRDSLLPGTQLLFLNQEVPDPRLANRIDAFLTHGGTLFFASPLGKTNAASNQQQWTSSLNPYLLNAGIYHVYNPLDNSIPALSPTIPGYIDFNHILKTIEQGTYSSLANNETTGYITHTILMLAGTFNADSSTGMVRLHKALGITANVKPATPTLTHPIYKNDWKAYLAYLMGMLRWDRSISAVGKPNSVDSSYIYFPGAVAEGTRRVDTTVSVNIRTGSDGLPEPEPLYYRPHSTGLYIAAGESVKVQIAAADTGLHCKLQIGLHDDEFYQSDVIVRQAYSLTKSFDVTDTVTTITSPWGGLLYVAVPDTAGAGSLTIRVRGAVPAPRFVAGRTSNEAWQRLRQEGAPWAELETDKLILTVPSARIRHLDQPASLMAFWDQVMDADADLAHIPHQRKHPERILIDLASPAGYMCTTPQKIFAPDDESCALLLNETDLRKKGSWGHFHELGHRHQFWPIEFSETGEVTVNLYTMYVYDKVLHKGLYNHEDISDSLTVRKRIKTYLSAQPDLKKFGKDPFSALCMYIQLIENFGWEPLKTVYASYRKLPEDSYPKTEDERRDRWFTEICKATGRNLDDFFKIWGIPISATALKSAAAYPSWLPGELSEFAPKHP